MKRRTVLALIAAAFAPAAFAPAAFADRPKRAAATYRIYSRNHEYFADINAEIQRTVVYAVDRSGRPVPLWEIPGWFRVAMLSNDGASLVTGYDGSNLLDQGFSPEDIMLTFYHRGRLTTVIRLKELVADPGKLPSTVSHWRWGEYLGFDEVNRFQVKTVEGKLLSFDPVTGKRLD